MGLFPWSPLKHWWGTSKSEDTHKVVNAHCDSRYERKRAASAGLRTFPSEDMHWLQAQTVRGILHFNQKKSRVNLFLLPKHNLHCEIWPHVDLFCPSSSLCRCYSYVSRFVKHGQVVSIGHRCDRLGIIEHEIMHCLGLHHEQSRYDRDDHITIKWDNIRDGNNMHLLQHLKIQKVLGSTRFTLCLSCSFAFNCLTGLIKQVIVQIWCPLRARKRLLRFIVAFQCSSGLLHIIESEGNGRNMETFASVT